MNHFFKLGLATFFPVILSAQEKYSLKFNSKNYTIETVQVGDKEISFRAYKDIVYVSKPVDTQYQKMNIYIPVEYFEGKYFGKFTRETAPIFFPNNVGGYMPAEAGVAQKDSKTGSDNAILVALSKGYVVASAGARGRTTQNEKGEYIGKAPAGLVDLKAAVRYLRLNDKRMPGNAEKIISNGTSAGGAMSVLLGATGNHKDYLPYLKELGAGKTRDDIFAVSAYCPITDLDHADMAYEWQFNGVNDYKKMSIEMLDYRVERKLEPGTLTDSQIKLSDELKTHYANYVNQLNLKDKNGNLLKLDDNGNGTFKQWIEYFVLQSAQKQLDLGQDVSDRTWLTINNGKVIAMDFAEYVKKAGRQKTPPAFDGIDLGAGENQLFGTKVLDKQHFTAFSLIRSTVTNATRADEQIVKMMNPLYYISSSMAKVSQYWRVRHGTNDRDTSLAIPVILSTKLENEGKNVDFALPWDKGHSGDYDLEELFDWIDDIVKR